MSDKGEYNTYSQKKKTYSQTGKGRSKNEKSKNYLSRMNINNLIYNLKHKYQYQL